MQIDPGTLDQTSIYKLLISSVVPRPIAWVSTYDAAGMPNLAPFSYFMAITDQPPTIAFSCSPRASGKKDTLTNVEALGQFVVNIVDDDCAEQMNLTSGEYLPEVDEFALSKLTAVPATKVTAPRVAEAPISMECNVVKILPVGRAHLTIGEVVHWHVRDDVYDPTTGRFDMHRLKPLGRLTGNLYSHIHQIFEMKRPNPDYRG
ncbi:MAG: flavin reductase family protein [Candidatus Rokuibacteriota bacterium]|nr:MAG: flavin reductase family protein [Candidatus Rokubacteria bacterium]